MAQKLVISRGACILKMRNIKNRMSCIWDIKMSRAVLMYFIVNILNLTIKNILPISESMWSLLSYFFMLLMFIIVFMALPDAISKNSAFFFLSEGLMLGLYIISYLRGFAINGILLKGAFWTMGVCVPLATLVYSIHDYTYLLISFKKISYVLSMLLWLVLLNMINLDTYNMAASYALVIPTLILIDEAFKEHRIIDIVFPTISAVLIILWGARGPLLCISAYMVISFFFYLRPTKLKIFFFVIGILLLFIVVFAWSEIMEWITNVYLANGMVGSHTIGRLVNGKLFDGSGRDTLVMRYMSLLNEHPILGLGLYGGWDSSGSGPHNMVVEYLTEFGYPIGIMVSGCSVFLYILPLLVKRGVDKRLLFIFLAFNIPMLWVQGVWTEKPEWFMFVAMVLAVWKKRTTIKTYNVWKCNEGDKNDC